MVFFQNTDFFGGVSVDIANPEENEGGFVMYKRMDDLFDDYIKRMQYYEASLDSVNKHNDRITRNLAIVRWVKHAIDVGVTAATGGSSLSVTLTEELLSRASGIVGSNISSSELSERWVKVFEEAEKILGTEIMTFVNDNFKKIDPPTTPQKPTANFSEMYFEGRLTQVDPKSGPMIFTPGTYGSSINTFIPDQHHYPVYNEPLGVFALLEKPKVKVSQTDILNDSECYNYSSTPFSYYIEHTLSDGEVILQWINIEIPFKKASIFKEIQLKLKDKLSYTFNPALNIKDYNIEASFDVKLNKNEGSEAYPIDSYNFGDIDFKENVIVNNYPKHNVNIESINYNTEIAELLSDVDTLRFNTVYQPIDAILSTTYSFGQEVQFAFPENGINVGAWEQNEIIAYEMHSYNNSLYNNCNDLLSRLKEDKAQHYEVDDIYLKLLINVTYEGEKSDGSPHEYTYMFTYKVDDIDIDEDNPLYPNLPGSAGDITQYPENLYLKGETFDGSPVEGCQLNGDIYTCKAWNDITLDGEFTVVPNYEVKVEAGNELDIIPEAVTPPEMQFSIVPVVDYSNPMPPVEDGYVTTFCQDVSRYQAGVASKSLGKMENIM